MHANAPLRRADARSHRFLRLMHVKKPGKPDGLPGFFRHSSFKTAGLKLPGTPETAAFDAEQGDFPQAPFVAVREI